ncbi:MAG: Gfo/Idh/MocA family oxidoreductase [Candidatus Aminicenantes bacterium]
MSDKIKANTRSGSAISRRTFLNYAASSAVTFTIVPRYVLGGKGHVAPSDTLNIAIIGTGGQGINNMKDLLRYPDIQIAAICDVNEESDYSEFYYGGTAGRFPALAVLKNHYASLPDSKGKKLCPDYIDFQEMLEKEKAIDAVLIATPDHIHAIAVLAAIEAKKHVFCEKPLTHSIYETRIVIEAARTANVATQMGNHGHSSEDIRLMVEWIRDGAIGQVREVHAWTRAGKDCPIERVTRPEGTPPVPSGLDWRRWLGPVEYRPYHPEYFPYKWRGWWAFGNGALGDMGCHNIDAAFWALDLRYPDTVEASTVELNDETAPVAAIVHYTFPERGELPPLKLTWYDGGLQPPRPEELEPERRMGEDGLLFVGDKGKILAGGWSESPRIIPETKMKAYKRPAPTIPRVEGHRREWIDACKGGAPASANFDYGGPLTELVLLGTVAMRTQKKLYWDGPNMKATNAPEADEYIRPVYHNGWTLG